MTRWLAVRLATLLVAGLGTAWWLVDVAPPHALIGLFDPGFESGTPLTPSDALEVMLPEGTKGAARSEVVATLVRAVQSIGQVQEVAKGHLLILPWSPDPAYRAELERMLAGTQGQFEIVPIIDEGKRIDAFRQLARDHSELGVDAPEGALLVAQSEASLRAGLKAAASCAGCALASDEAVLIEHDDARPEYGEAERWKALLVSRAPPVFDQHLLETAFASYNDRNEPIVLVTMTAEGATRFAALTEAHLDKRLAIAVGDKVLMAPTIRGVITGGHVEIPIGRGSAADTLSEAHALVAQLLPGLQLPPGTTWQWRQLLGADPGAVLAAQVVTVVLAMALALLLIILGRRWLRPEFAPASFYGAEPIRVELGSGLRFLATAALGGSLVLLAKIPLPLPEASMLGDGIVSRLADPAEAFTLTSLGLPSIFLAHLLVALVVSLVPALRRFRGGGLTARRALLPVTVLVTFALATLQGLVLARMLSVYPEFDTSGATLGLVALMLAGGVLVLWVIAAAITRFGVGNGFVALSLALLASSLASQEEPLPSPLAAALLMLAGLACLLSCLRVRAGSGTRRLPLAGLVPLDLGATLIGLSLVFGPLLGWRLPDVSLTPVLALALLAVLGVLLSWLIARPIGLRALLPATFAGVGLLLLIVVAHAGLAGDADLSWFVSIVTLPLLLTDVFGELAMWLRRGPLVRVASTSDVDLAGRWLALLGEAGIAATLRGVRMRALLRFMGPWLPVEVLVPKAAFQATLTLLTADANFALIAPFGD